MASEVARHLADWLERPNISARTVLVTIFGDVVRPVQDNVWLSQLFELSEPFGFSTRLVRTSLSRLVNENWMTSERIGRRSTYALTTLAQRESDNADQRIYRPPRAQHREQWTVVAIDPRSVDDGELEPLMEGLGWHGFTPIAPDIVVSPTTSTDRARELIGRLAPFASASIGGTSFDDVSALVANAQRVDSFDRSAQERAYATLATTYGALLEAGHGSFESHEAYVLRVMFVHDLRRLILRSKPTPRELLPSPWVGDQVFALATDLYRQVCEATASWLSETLGTDYPPRLVERFTGY